MSTLTLGFPRATASPPRLRVALATLVRRGLRDYRRAPLVWGLSLGLMSAFEMLLYPSISTSLDKAFESYPAAVTEAFGITDFGTIEAFMHAEMFSIVLPFALAYFAIRCVATMLAGAEEHGYLDSLLAAPVARSTVAAAAFATAALAAAAILFVVGAMTAVAGAISGDAIGLGRLAEGLAGVWALTLFFAGCATFAAGLAHRAGVVLGSVGALFGVMYLLDVVGKLSDPIEPLRHASALRWYGAPLQGGLELAGFAILVAAATLLALAGAICAMRRDVTG